MSPEKKEIFEAEVGIVIMTIAALLLVLAVDWYLKKKNKKKGNRHEQSCR